MLVFSDILEEHGSFEMSGYVKPVTQCHVPEYLDLEPEVLIMQKKS